MALAIALGLPGAALAQAAPSNTTVTATPREPNSVSEIVVTARRLNAARATIQAADWRFGLYGDRPGHPDHARRR